MAQTLREFLREYGAKLPENVLEGRLRRVLSNRTRSKLYLETEYDRPMTFAQLSETETELASRLEVESFRTPTGAWSQPSQPPARPPHCSCPARASSFCRR